MLYQTSYSNSVQKQWKNNHIISSIGFAEIDKLSRWGRRHWLNHIGNEFHRAGSCRPKISSNHWLAHTGQTIGEGFSHQHKKWFGDWSENKPIECVGTVFLWAQCSLSQGAIPHQYNNRSHLLSKVHMYYRPRLTAFY